MSRTIYIFLENEDLKKAEYVAQKLGTNVNDIINMSLHIQLPRFESWVKSFDFPQISNDPKYKSPEKQKGNTDSENKNHKAIDRH